jgi:hypothetical protein
MSTILVVLLVIAGLMILWMVAWGLFWLLVQGGLIAQAAMTPPTTDTHDYTLDQGREVKGEEQ